MCLAVKGMPSPPCGAIPTGASKEARLDNGCDVCRSRTWKEFLCQHWEVLVAGDSFTVEVWTGRGLTRFMVLFLIDLSTRRVEVAGVAGQANGLWMDQVARNLCDERARADTQAQDRTPQHPVESIRYWWHGVFAYQRMLVRRREATMKVPVETEFRLIDLRLIQHPCFGAQRSR